MEWVTSQTPSSSSRNNWSGSCHPLTVRYSSCSSGQHRPAVLTAPCRKLCWGSCRHFAVNISSRSRRASLKMPAQQLRLAGVSTAVLVQHGLVGSNAGVIGTCMSQQVTQIMMLGPLPLGLAVGQFQVVATAAATAAAISQLMQGCGVPVCRALPVLVIQHAGQGLPGVEVRCRQQQLHVEQQQMQMRHWEA